MTDDAADLASSLRLVSAELSQLAESIVSGDADEANGVLDELRSARRVFVLGAGRSGLALRMTAMRLMHLGLAVHVAGDTTTPAIEEGDLLLTASGSGTTGGIVRAAATAKDVGARIVALTTAHALELAAAAAEHVDVLELGTPLIKAEGLPAITALKQAHPDKTIFADLKTMDAGALEADIAFKAGADLVTVLGVADDSTIAGAVQAAKEHGKGVVVDLIGVADKAARAREVVALGAEFVEMHAGLDEQAQPGYSLDGLLEAGRAAGVPFSVAGGVSAATIAAVKAAGAQIAVAGGALYGAPDVSVAAEELRAAAV